MSFRARVIPSSITLYSWGWYVIPLALSNRVSDWLTGVLFLFPVAVLIYLFVPRTVAFHADTIEWGRHTIHHVDVRRISVSESNRWFTVYLRKKHVRFEPKKTEAGDVLREVKLWAWQNGVSTRENTPI